MKTLKKLTDLDAYFSGICLAIILIVGTSGVLSRYLLPISLQWSEELSRFLLMWFGMLSCSVAVGKGSHLLVDIVPNTVLKNKKYARRVLRIIADVVFIIWAVSMIIYGWNSTISTIELSPGLGLHMKYVYFSIPFGMTYTCVRLIADIILTLKGKFDFNITGGSLTDDTESLMRDAINAVKEGDDK